LLECGVPKEKLCVKVLTDSGDLKCVFSSGATAVVAAASLDIDALVKLKVNECLAKMLEDSRPTMFKGGK
jgi:hypothetical protein